MLALSRYNDEGLVFTVGDTEFLVKTRIVWDGAAHRRKVRVYVDAPQSVVVVRDELLPSNHPWSRTKPQDRCAP